MGSASHVRPDSRAAARRAGWLVLAALVAACGSLGQKPPSRLHALEVPLPAADARAVPCAIRFSVRDLRLAGHLERPEVVIARDGSRIVADGADLWAAPLAPELRRVLSDALAVRLAGSQAVPHPWRLNEAPRLAVALDVDRLEPAGGALQASIGWRLVDVAGGGTLAWGRWQARQALGDPGARGADATVAAIDAALGQFADMLATRIVADPVAGGWCRAAPDQAK